jgi:hypothetical protein
MTPQEGMALQRTNLLHTGCRDDLPAASKLAAYLSTLSNFASLRHASLIVYSETLSFQTVLQEKAIYPFSPSPARAVPPYSVVHQLTEIIQDDPTNTISRFSKDDSLPADLQTLANEEVLLDLS